VVGCGERGVEEAWLGAGELEVRLADRLHPEPGASRGVRSRADLAHPVGHAPSELCHRLVADRREQPVAVGEMPVGGVGDDADHARHLAQHDRVRAARSRELEAGLGARRRAGAVPDVWALRSPAADPRSSDRLLASHEV
jgi:hypothetical protein